MDGGDACERQGFGSTVRSWVGNGPNQAMTADELHQVLGSDAVKNLAARVGMTPDEILAKLSAALPKVVDHLTPDGRLPASAGPPA
jgi:uncharacterized protein YidB (DUF937 family)